MELMQYCARTCRSLLTSARASTAEKCDRSQ